MKYKLLKEERKMGKLSIKNLNINDIEALSIEEVKAIALEKLNVKGFDIYLVDLGEYFGYSALVFKDEHHIYFANLYEVHYRYNGPTHEQLKDKYISLLNNKLFIDEELTAVKDHEEYEKKIEFIRNYMPQEYDYLTAFCINGIYKGKDKEKYESGEYTAYSNIAFAYFKDNSYHNRAKPLINKLERSYKEAMENIDNFKEAVKQALYNYEACITCEYETALDSLGLNYEDLPKNKQEIVIGVFNEVTSIRY